MPSTLRKRVKTGKRLSQGEEYLAFQLRAMKIPFRREVQTHPDRKWRWDFVIEPSLCIDIQGGTRSQGRHTRGSGYKNDLEKQNAAVLLGWDVLLFTTEHVTEGVALKVIEEYLEGRRAD